MQRATFLTIFLALGISGGTQARADVIAGPTLDSNGSTADESFGLEFMALDNSTLTAFDFTQRVAGIWSGNVNVQDITAGGMPIVYSTPYALNPNKVISYTGLSIGLIAGHTYWLFATSNIFFGTPNEWTAFTTYPSIDSDISVNAGIHGLTTTPANTHDFYSNFIWYSFNNITTTSAREDVATPEPASLTLLGLGLVGMACGGWRRRKQAA